MYKLIIEDDEGKTTVVPLIRDEISIGRKEGNTIRLTERNVSRRHARLLRQNGAVFIEDNDSYNGIKINGGRINGRAPLSEGDRIQIGDYQLALKLDKGAAAGAAGGPPAGEVRDERTVPFSKDGGTPTAMIDAGLTMQTPLLSKDDTPADGIGRVVVVSSNFAGQQFLLDKAAVVIGRTDDNDVVINHRSMSRNHAKIVREGGNYHIVDLQSANGVRVNGEEYGKVELRSGDQIDLGHVRLRFVAPGESFVFERDAQIVEVPGSIRGRSKGMGALVAVMIALAGGALLLVKLTGSKPAGPGPETAQPADVEGQVARLLVASDRASKAEDWDESIARCDEVLRLDPTQELARDKRQRAEAEKKNRSAHSNFIAASDRQDFDSAIASYGEIAEDSVYRQKGAELYARAKTGYLRTHLDAARRAKESGACEEARQHVEAVLTIDESNLAAQDLAKTCGAVAVAVAPPPAPPRPRVEPAARPARPQRPVTTAAATPKEPRSKEPSEASPAVAAPVSAQCEKQLQDAQDAYVHGQYQSAIDQAKRSAKCAPSKAWRIIGASSCFVKDRGGAVSAWNRLDTQGRQFLKYVCARNTITVP